MSEKRYLLKEHRHRKLAILMDGLLFAYATKEVTPGHVAFFKPGSTTQYCQPHRDTDWEVHPLSPFYPLLFSTRNPDGVRAPDEHEIRLEA